MGLLAAVFTLSVYSTMTFMIKKEEVKVPLLSGLSYEEAMKVANNCGCSLNRINNSFDKSFKPLEVMAQIPEVGIKIKKGSSIKVFVNSEAIIIKMIDLKGLSLKEADIELNKAGLRKRYISYIHNANVAEDLVLAQSVAKGRDIALGSEVDLLVSSGSKSKSYIMPDLIGMNVNDVETFLADYGLKITDIHLVNYPGVSSDLIINQSPASGFKISGKNLITLQVTQ